MTRCFVGVLLPDEVKGKVISLQNKLQILSLNCKFVELENLHICISFLGEVNEGDIDGINHRLDAITSRYEPPEVHVSGIKLVPNEKFIRVIVLGIESGVLETISKNVKKEIGGDVKPPHITLCRVRNIPNKEKIIDAVNSIEPAEMNFTISSICLIKSEVRRTGPVYTTIHESKLGNFS